MENILQLQRMPVAEGNLKGMGNRTPGDVSAGLFKKVLAKINGSSEKKDGGLFLYGDALETVTDNAGTNGRDKKGKGKILAGLEQVALPLGQVQLPEHSIPRLIQYLENQGLNKEKINELIQSAKGPDGLIRMDRLMASLKNQDLFGKASIQGRVFKPEDLPRLEEILYRCGLGTGEVREVIETSKNREGAVVEDRLSEALGRAFGDPSRGRKIISLFEQLDIRPKADLETGNLINGEIKKVLTGFSGAQSEDLQKIFKQNMAALLREKGIPPQEVKSFLDSMTVSSTTTLLKKSDATQNQAVKARLGKESADLLNRVVIRSQPQWYKGGWKEKILDVLKKENLIAEKDLELLQSKGGEGLKLNAVELFKQGIRGQNIQTHPSIHSEKGPVLSDLNGFRDSGEGEKGQSKEMLRDNPQPKAGFEAHLHSDRMERASQETGIKAQARPANTLPQPLPKIMDRMMWMVRAGEQRGRIHISPPELGRLDLDLVIKQGHLQANINAESPVVKELIEANLNQLKQQLTDQGFVVDRFEVMAGLDDRKNHRGEEKMARGRRDQSLRRSGRIGSVAEDERTMPSPARLSAHEIDVHV